jgi:hypothetical protein
MTIHRPRTRAVARDLSRLAAALSACMFVIVAWSAFTASLTPASAAATNNGVMTIAPTSGSSSTAIALSLPSGAACPGDTATGNYTWQTFIIPAGVDIAGTLTFGSTGPTAVGSEFRKALYNATGSRIVNKATDLGTGVISGIPGVKFANYTPGQLPAGDYSIGIACTLGSAGPTQLKSYWVQTITVTANPGGADPAQITFVQAVPTTTTTTTASTTTTTTGSTTTTVVAGGVGSTTTTGLSTTSSTESVFGGSPISPSPISSVGQLPVTGRTTAWLVAWGVLLVVFGRMAILFARPVKVLDSAR